jgi:hypothetical protein
MYDPSSIYYNKDELVINLGLGYFSYIGNEIYNHYGSPYDFNNEKTSPVYNATLDYGVTEKHTLGLGITYQQEMDYNTTPYPLTEKLSIMDIAFRYTHSMGSWELLYYGFRAGIAFWDYKLYGSVAAGNINGNIVQIPINTISSSTTQAVIQLLLGARLTFSKNIIIHLEAGVLDPYTLEGGITFKINTISKKQQNIVIPYHQFSHQDSIHVGLHPAIKN